MEIPFDFVEFVLGDEIPLVDGDDEGAALLDDMVGDDEVLVAEAGEGVDQ